MPRLLGLLAAFALLAATFPSTAAAAPERASSTQTSMYCEIPSTAGPVTVRAEITDVETFVSVVVWAPDESPLAISLQTDATFDGTDLTARFQMFDAVSGEPLGSADLSASFTPAGPVEDFDSREIRDGNQWIRLAQTIQFLDVAGSLNLSVGDAKDTIQLGACDASVFAQSLFVTNPNAWIGAVEQIYISCEWVNERGSVFLLATADEVDTVSQAVVIQGDRAFSGLTAPTLSAFAFDAVYQLSDAETGEPAGTVMASALLSGSGERITDNERDGEHRLRTTGERLSVEGTLTIDVLGASTRLVMDDTACEAGDVRMQLMEKGAQD